jgi:SagB-type dehydrogenase family enzyme
MSSSLVVLPKPVIRAGTSLEQTLAQRRSHRTFAETPLTLAQLAQLLWAGQGRSGDYDGRTAPSAGGVHPLRLHVVAGRVDDLEPGVYRYRPATHDLETLASGDMRAELRDATGHQECLGEGAADIVIGAAAGPTRERYGERGLRYLHMEAGHVGQNVALQATALGLAVTTVAAFDDEAMARGARLEENELALYAIPVGHPR